MSKRISFIVVVLLICNVIAHIPFLSQPVVDTEADYYYTAETIGNNHFNFFTPTEEEKVPIIFIFPSLLTKLYPSLLWGRLETLSTATIALVYVYLLSTFLYSSFVGLMAVVICMMFPMFAIQSVFFTDAMPQTAVFLATLYYFITKRKRGYLISASLA